MNSTRRTSLIKHDFKLANFAFEMCHLIEAVSRETCQTHRSCVTVPLRSVLQVMQPYLPSPPLLFYGPVASLLGHKPDGKKTLSVTYPTDLELS